MGWRGIWDLPRGLVKCDLEGPVSHDAIGITAKSVTLLELHKLN